MAKKTTFKWEEKYGSAHAFVGRAGIMSVSPTHDPKDPGYKVQILGNTLKLRSTDMEDGKRRAINAARLILAEALEVLPPAREKGRPVEAEPNQGSLDKADGW